MSLRLRFWLGAMDVVHAMGMRFRRGPLRLRDGAWRLYLWTLSKASDATTWDDVRQRMEENEDAPF